MDPTAGPTQLLFIPFTYTVTSAQLAANATGVTPLLLDQDYDFELHFIMGRSTGDGVADIRPNNFSFQIKDGQSGRNWSDSLIPQYVVAQIPGGMTMKRPVVIARRTNIQVTFTNLTAGNLTPSISLIGAKILAR